MIQAVKKQMDFMKKGEEDNDDRKRKYNSMISTEVRVRMGLVDEWI